MSALAAVLAALALVLWRGRPARARDRLSAGAPRTGTPRRGARREERVRDAGSVVDALAVALAVDLMAACLEAGVPLPAALSAASTVAGSRCAAALESTAAALRRGADSNAWAACDATPQLALVVRICRRISTTGAAAAEDLRRLAAELRRADHAEQRRRAQRAGVWVVLPLGLCFLPAFVLLTVVPVVTALLPALR